MKLHVILPSSRLECVPGRQAVYAAAAHSMTEVTAVALDSRVPLEADPADPFLVPEICDRACRSAAEGGEAIVVDCMDDPAVEQARRLVDIPVIGPMHAALQLASMLGHRFSILYPLPQVRFVEELVVRYGVASRLASIRVLACGLDGLAERDSALADMTETALDAIRNDGAHIIVPACTLTSGLTGLLMRNIEAAGYAVPVIDGPAAAVQLAESLVLMGLRHSRLTYPEPLGVTRRIA